MRATWGWLNNDAGAICIILTVLTAFWAAWRYLSQKHQELQLQKFKTYHQLIRELVAPDDKGKMWLDAQLAVVFELRRFPAYFEASLGILKGLLKTWGDDKERPRRLIDEMDITIAEIEKKSKTKRHRVKQWFRNFSTY